MVEVGAIPAGTTATPRTLLSVQSGYNYYLDAVLWTDSVVVTSTRAAANLNPTETISVNRTKREIGLQVGAFEPDSGSEGAGPGTTPTAETGGDGPGFGITAALGALVAGLLALRIRGETDD